MKRKFIVVLLSMSMLMSCGQAVSSTNSQTDKNTESSTYSEKDIDSEDDSQVESQKPIIEETHYILEDPEEFRWPRVEPWSNVPKPNSELIGTMDQRDYSVYCNIVCTSKDEFNDYIDMCEDAGFTYGEYRKSDKFDAMNKDGLNVRVEWERDYDETYNIYITLAEDWEMENAGIK